MPPLSQTVRRRRSAHSLACAGTAPAPQCELVPSEQGGLSLARAALLSDLDPHAVRPGTPRQDDRQPALSTVERAPHLARPRRRSSSKDPSQGRGQLPSPPSCGQRAAERHIQSKSRL